jgi:hypothetical protein
MEMSKDFEQLCPEVRISLNQQGADYTVALNHIEHGLSRDNQIQVANKDAALISKTKEGGSIKGGVKKGVRLDTCRLGQEIIGISACHNVTLPQVQSPSPGVVPRHSQPPGWNGARLLPYTRLSNGVHGNLCLRSTVDTALEIYRQLTLGLRGRLALGFRFCGVPRPA